MAEVQTPVITLTESAVTELKSVREKDQIPANKYLRVGVKGGGCAGMSYILDFDEKQDFDDIFEIDGVAVVLDRRHALYLAGMEVDYQYGLNDRGFIFNNPNAKSSCGCGTSFSA
ncbi:MAG: iron-sulfur cluster assembly accessory protein [Bacteroidia bacterium]|nr:iron-sulfur cluster assembly accessory protein [Bacteroidia bacterium]